MDMRGIEPRTSSMQMMRATTVPHALVHLTVANFVLLKTHKIQAICIPTGLLSVHLRLCEAPVHSGQVIMHAKTNRLDCAVLYPITHGDLLNLWLPWLD